MKRLQDHCLPTEIISGGGRQVGHDRWPDKTGKHPATAALAGGRHAIDLSSFVKITEW